ncbi:hypothetical protein BC629DRAFT_1550032 [Irpex lacteus]|nr:hypothetical protein BC629DRAFT_1550032 [Irpex lacteus]
MSGWDEASSSSTQSHSEFDYMSLLNGVLPSTLRVLSWRGRWSFRRIVRSAEIIRCTLRRTGTPAGERQDDDQGELYVFDLVGTAFLYNQVRHIMAVLFLIGTGWSILSYYCSAEFIQIRRTNTTYRLAKPTYQMADALPLVLWDCKYDKEDVHGSAISILLPPSGVSAQAEEKQTNVNGLYAELRSIHERSWVHTALHDHFLKAASRYHRPPKELLPFSLRNLTTLCRPFRMLLDRKRLDEVEVMWERWKNGKGSKVKKSVAVVERASTPGLEGNERLIIWDY